MSPGDTVATERVGRRVRVEVLHVHGCPHYAAVLALVERVRAELGIDTELRSTLVGDHQAAERVGFPGSPTVRVDGRDVDPAAAAIRVSSLACRLYRHEHGLSGQPAERWIRDALLAADPPAGKQQGRATMSSTPDLGSGTAFEHALLATAFGLLLADGRPVSPARLAAALASDPSQVTGTLARLDQQGRVRLDPAGAVTGSHGLSVAPTRHELLFHEESGEQRRFWTWCAWDAVGILAALEASGRVRSTSPSSGAPVEVTFHRGSLSRADPALVVFFADADCCGTDSVVDQWCPLVNFFEHADAAKAWAAKHGVRGTAVPLAEATDRGKDAWTRWVA